MPPRREAPERRRVWNQDLITAFDARLQVCIHRRSRQQYMWEVARKEVEAVNRDIYMVASSGNILNLPNFTHTTARNAAYAIINGRMPIIPTDNRRGDAPGSEEEDQGDEEEGGDPRIGELKRHPYIREIKHRGGAYAILKACEHLHIASGGRTVFFRAELIREAQRFCDAEMSPDHWAGRDFGAWSGIRTLNRHGLVEHINNIAGRAAHNFANQGPRDQYILTQKGWDFAYLMYEVRPDWDQTERRPADAGPGPGSAEEDGQEGNLGIVRGRMEPASLRNLDPAIRATLIEFVRSAPVGETREFQGAKKVRQGLHKLCEKINDAQRRDGLCAVVDHQSVGTGRQRKLRVQLLRPPVGDAGLGPATGGGGGPSHRGVAGPADGGVAGPSNVGGSGPSNVGGAGPSYAGGAGSAVRGGAGPSTRVAAGPPNARGAARRVAQVGGSSNIHILQTGEGRSSDDEDGLGANGERSNTRPWKRARTGGSSVSTFIALQGNHPGGSGVEPRTPDLGKGSNTPGNGERRGGGGSHTQLGGRPCVGSSANKPRNPQEAAGNAALAREAEAKARAAAAAAKDKGKQLAYPPGGDGQGTATPPGGHQEPQSGQGYSDRPGRVNGSGVGGSAVAGGSSPRIDVATPPPRMQARVPVATPPPAHAGVPIATPPPAHAGVPIATPPPAQARVPVATPPATGDRWRGAAANGNTAERRDQGGVRAGQGAGGGGTGGGVGTRTPQDDLAMMERVMAAGGTVKGPAVYPPSSLGGRADLQPADRQRALTVVPGGREVATGGSRVAQGSRPPRGGDEGRGRSRSDQGLGFGGMPSLGNDDNDDFVQNNNLFLDSSSGEYLDEQLAFERAVEESLRDSFARNSARFPGGEWEQLVGGGQGHLDELDRDMQTALELSRKEDENSRRMRGDVEVICPEGGSTALGGSQSVLRPPAQRVPTKPPPASAAPAKVIDLVDSDDDDEKEEERGRNGRGADGYRVLTPDVAAAQPRMSTPPAAGRQGNRSVAPSGAADNVAGNRNSGAGSRSGRTPVVPPMDVIDLSEDDPPIVPPAPVVVGAKRSLAFVLDKAAVTTTGNVAGAIATAGPTMCKEGRGVGAGSLPSGRDRADTREDTRVPHDGNLEWGIDGGGWEVEDMTAGGYDDGHDCDADKGRGGDVNAATTSRGCPARRSPQPRGNRGAQTPPPAARGNQSGDPLASRAGGASSGKRASPDADRTPPAARRRLAESGTYDVILLDGGEEEEEVIPQAGAAQMASPHSSPRLQRGEEVAVAKGKGKGKEVGKGEGAGVEEREDVEEDDPERVDSGADDGGTDTMTETEEEEEDDDPDDEDYDSRSGLALSDSRYGAGEEEDSDDGEDAGSGGVGEGEDEGYGVAGGRGRRYRTRQGVVGGGGKPGNGVNTDGDGAHPNGINGHGVGGDDPVDGANIVTTHPAQGQAGLGREARSDGRDGGTRAAGRRAPAARTTPLSGKKAAGEGRGKGGRGEAEAVGGSHRAHVAAAEEEEEEEEEGDHVVEEDGEDGEEEPWEEEEEGGEVPTDVEEVRILVCLHERKTNKAPRRLRDAIGAEMRRLVSPPVPIGSSRGGARTMGNAGGGDVRDGAATRDMMLDPIPERSSLPLGDYMWCRGGTVLDCNIERKTIKDLVERSRTRDHLKQIHRTMGSPFSRRFLLLEGKNETSKNQVAYVPGGYGPDGRYRGADPDDTYPRGAYAGGAGAAGNYLNLGAGPSSSSSSSFWASMPLGTGTIQCAADIDALLAYLQGAGTGFQALQTLDEQGTCRMLAHLSYALAMLSLPDAAPSGADADGGLTRPTLVATLGPLELVSPQCTPAATNKGDALAEWLSQHARVSLSAAKAVGARFPGGESALCAAYRACEGDLQRELMLAHLLEGVSLPMGVSARACSRAVWHAVDPPAGGDAPGGGGRGAVASPGAGVGANGGGSGGAGNVGTGAEAVLPGASGHGQSCGAGVTNREVVVVARPEYEDFLGMEGRLAENAGGEGGEEGAGAGRPWLVVSIDKEIPAHMVIFSVQNETLGCSSPARVLIRLPAERLLRCMGEATGDLTMGELRGASSQRRIFLLASKAVARLLRTMSLDRKSLQRTVDKYYSSESDCSKWQQRVGQRPPPEVTCVLEGLSSACQQVQKSRGSVFEALRAEQRAMIVPSLRDIADMAVCLLLLRERWFIYQAGNDKETRGFCKVALNVFRHHELLLDAV
eukprot:jgi/Mesvir1/12245/Mv00464-RA.1